MTTQIQESEEVIPHSSIDGAPPTPPLTEEKLVREKLYIFRRIERYRFAKTDHTIYNVDRRLWAAVQPRLYWDHKLRLNYFPSTESLVLRRPTGVHRHFSSCLRVRVSDQLRLISLGSGSAAEFTKDIKDCGSTTITPLDPEYGTHDPDNSFLYLKPGLSGVIFEVAHSQEGRKFRTLAEDYIFGSHFKIRVMVGFDIEYSKSKRATFSVWRPMVLSEDGEEVWVVRPTIAKQVFRYDNGKPNINEDAGVRLRLEDFADQMTCRQFKDLDTDIFISCSELYQYLEEAEADSEAYEKIVKSKPVRDPGLIKRRRLQTPEEHRYDSDSEENAIVKAEKRAAKRRR